MSNNVADRNPIGEVVERLQAHGFDLSSADALEVFGRKGDWHTKYYADYVCALDVWEINPAFLSDLRRNLPSASVKITDSFEEIKTTSGKYDLVVIDNPQSVYGDGKYCEHFELFPHVFRVCKDACVIITNVNMEPYDFRQDSPWWDRRRAFYQTDAPDKLSFDYVAEHYAKLCEANGFCVTHHFFVPRNAFIYYLVCFISRKPDSRSAGRAT